MKAKYLTGIIAGLLAFTAPAGAAEAPAEATYPKTSPGVVVSTSVRGHDYFYASRIRRFHRSYVSFGFYSPVYTEAYWYTYRPATWGVSIYAGNTTFGMGYSFGYPDYYFYGGYSPWAYYGSYYPSYYGYDYYPGYSYSYWSYPRFNHRVRIRNSYHYHYHNYYTNYYSRPRHHYQRYLSNNSYYNYPARKYASSSRPANSRRNVSSRTSTYNRNAATRPATDLRANQSRRGTRVNTRNTARGDSRTNKTTIVNVDNR
ncbi:MAG TPA: hypothetical protein VJ877_01765, partial [Bacteroidales bacterium]|nr:hypothetical protein [Bacteroidales bacterium]